MSRETGPALNCRFKAGVSSAAKGSEGEFWSDVAHCRNGECTALSHPPVCPSFCEQQIFREKYAASVMHFDVSPEARMGGYGVRLLKAFEQWAQNRRASEICFGIDSGTDTDVLGGFAQKMGYRPVGQNFVKDAI